MEEYDKEGQSAGTSVWMEEYDKEEQSAGTSVWMEKKSNKFLLVTAMVRQCISHISNHTSMIISFIGHPLM